MVKIYIYIYIKENDIFVTGSKDGIQQVPPPPLWQGSSIIKGNATSIHSQVTDAQETRQPTWVFTKHKHASVSALGTTTKKYSVHVEI